MLHVSCCTFGPPPSLLRVTHESLTPGHPAGIRQVPRGGGPEACAHLHSGTKIQPKEEVFGRTSLRTSGQKLRSGPPNAGKTIGERPPGLLQHVLTVLVFWSWVLLLPRLPSWSRSLRLFPWDSILLLGSLGICLDLLPAAPRSPVQKRDAQHMLLEHRVAHAETSILGFM